MDPEVYCISSCGWGN